MDQDEKPALNRAQRRELDREVKRSIKTGVGVSVSLAGYRVVRPDGTVKLAVGRQPAKAWEEQP